MKLIEDSVFVCAYVSTSTLVRKSSQDWQNLTQLLPQFFLPSRSVLVHTKPAWRSLLASLFSSEGDQPACKAPEERKTSSCSVLLWDLAAAKSPHSLQKGKVKKKTLVGPCLRADSFWREQDAGKTLVRLKRIFSPNFAAICYVYLQLHLKCKT